MKFWKLINGEFPNVPKGYIFVFGSNLAGRHGLGAALTAAKYFGAVRGVGLGRTGNAYAIATKGRNLEPLPLFEIETYAKDFVKHANDNPGTNFFLTRIGCGLRGLKDAQVAPLFKGIGDNVLAPEAWRPYL